MIRAYIQQTLSHLSRMAQAAIAVPVSIMTAAILLVGSCTIEPPLELVDRSSNGNIELNKVSLDLKVLWSYDLTYDWQAEWYYDWDIQDETIFGSWDIAEPKVFNIRRYFTGENPYAPHTSVLADMVYGSRFESRYKYGYYDILVWNDVNTIDGVQSLHFDETSTLEYVVAYTNQSNQPTHAPHKVPEYSQSYAPGYAFYQPEFLFAGDYEDLHVSDNPDDYDSLIVETNTWYKYVPLHLTPVTYIYLPQIILHHNDGKITDVDGSGNLTGMARSVNMLTHITSEDAISVNHNVRMKKHILIDKEGSEEKEDVDIVGGRVFTFGLTGLNPNAITRSNNTHAQMMRSDIQNYLEVKFHFKNGTDSTIVWDVTDKVKERYKGGVITLHIDCDKIPLPNNNKGGGSGFDATVKDFDEETYEIPM